MKKKEIKKLIRNNKIEFCCVQETKLESIAEQDYRTTWGDGNFGWIYREAEGRSGGILSLWDD